jgi:hypothetical protein
MNGACPDAPLVRTTAGHIRVAADVAAAYTRGTAQILYKGKHFDWRQHEDNTRAFVKASVIWELGDEYERRGQDRKQYWRCGLCRKNTLLAIDGGSSSGLRHLKKKHKINSNGQRMKRDTVAEDTTEASECLKNWWDHGLIQQLDHGEVV